MNILTLDINTGASPVLVSRAQDGVSSIRRITFQVKPAAGGWSGTFVLKQLITGGVDNGLIATTDNVNAPYTDRSTNATVTIGTAIAAAGVFTVDCNGVDVYLVYTHTSGSAKLIINPMVG